MWNVLYVNINVGLLLRRKRRKRMTRLEVFEKLFEIEDKGIPNSD